MSWLRLSDDFVDRPEILKLGDRAPAVGWLYVRGRSYAARLLTNGFIPDGSLIGTNSTSVAALLATGLWQRVEGGYEDSEFLGLQDDRETVLARRAHAHEAKSKGGRARAAGQPARSRKGGQFTKTATSSQPSTRTRRDSSSATSSLPGPTSLSLPRTPEIPISNPQPSLGRAREWLMARFGSGTWERNGHGELLDRLIAQHTDDAVVRALEAIPDQPDVRPRSSNCGTTCTRPSAASLPQRG
jgi:hypothetical protein